MDVAKFNVLLGPVVAQPARGLGRELQQGLDRSRRLRARTQLQQLAEQRQRDDHRRGLAVHAAAAVLVGRLGEDAWRDRDRKSVASGMSESVRVVLGGGRIIKRKTI